MEFLSTIHHSKANLFKWAFGLAVFTIVYNIIEGVVSVFFGFEDGSLSLFGFGADSFMKTRLLYLKKNTAVSHLIFGDRVKAKLPNRDTIWTHFVKMLLL